MGPFTGMLISQGLNFGVNAVLGGIGQSQKNKAQQEADDRNYKNAKFNWRFQAEETGKRNKYQKEIYEAQIRNNQREREYNFEVAEQRYDYQMGIRQYQYDQSMRQYEQQIRQRDQQLSFNDQALDLAYRQQNQAKEDAMIGFLFDDAQNELDIRNEFNSTRNRANAAATELQGVRSAAALQSEQNIVAGIEAEGAARGSGRAGRSAAKETQAALAKNALQENVIAEGVTRAGYQFAQSINEITQNLEEAYEQFYLDREAITASRKSFLKADELTRQRIYQDYTQANMNAMNAVMLKPEIGPELPRPKMVPAIEYVKPYEIGIPDEPDRGSFKGGSQQSPVVSGLMAGVNSLDFGTLGQGFANLFNDPTELSDLSKLGNTLGNLA